MDLSQQLKNLVKEGRDTERLHKKLMELSMKKVQLERDIRDAKLELSSQQDKLMNVRKANVRLSNEFLVQEKRTVVAKTSTEELLKKIVHVENKTSNIQVLHFFNLF